MKKKICLIASSGGHYEQILMLKCLNKDYEIIIVTEKTDYKNTEDNLKMYYLKQLNRKEYLFLFNSMFNFIKSLKIFLTENPDVIISTGALATIPMCLICKICNKKIIFIESFAKINTPTLTGRVMYKIADQFYVQWESMLNVYPRAIYLGGIY